ncbi:MAG: prepilin-type N-terminal cleavage/methylation domain-containing protein [Gemmatimonadetes bacterium]|nr:prepilin-type N-terminal cleavage/methylation domain-containing protein [Gemmatimonadota bacterium]
MNRKGFTLIEVLIAVVLLSLAVISLGQFMGKFQNATAKATLLSTMTSIAKERIELIRGDPRYASLSTRYGTGASADTTGFPGYSMIRRRTFVSRDQTGAPARDRTTVTVRVFTTTTIVKDTVSLTAVIARP